MVKRGKVLKFKKKLGYYCEEVGLYLREMMFISPTLYNVITSWYIQNITIGDKHTEIILFKNEEDDILQYSKIYD